MRAELGMNCDHPTEAVMDPRRDSLSSPLHLITQPAVPTAQPSGCRQLTQQGIQFSGRAS